MRGPLTAFSLFLNLIDGSSSKASGLTPLYNRHDFNCYRSRRVKAPMVRGRGLLRICYPRSIRQIVLRKSHNSPSAMSSSYAKVNQGTYSGV